MPGAYLNADMRENIIILKTEDEFMNIMCEVNPEYRKNVRMENYVNLLYLGLLKYLYGCMEYILLWYNLYAKTLKAPGFVVNPYDICIENSTKDG